MILFQKKFSLVLAVIASSFMSTLFAQQTALLGQAPAVTISEYTDFLNCVAATDTYSLYNVKMGGEEGIAPIITRSGNPGSYTYSYNADKASCPITYVSWISAVRYCNWKSHHSPIGLQGTTTTETGSYDLTAFDQGADISTIILTPGANFFLPTNYLVDTTFQESNTSSCNHYLASSRFGFCIGTWTVPSSSSDASNASGNSLSQVGAGGTSASTSSGTSSGSTTISALKVSEATVTNVPSTTDSLLINTATNTNTNQINISLVVVGAPNNSADVSPSGTNKAATNQVGYGSVLMPYSIGTYDVTAYEYCAFLNAVAGKSDPHQLYNTNMTSDPDVACITRSGDANSGYTYTPISGREKFPITYVSWYSALRFCNWLENGQPTGDQVTALTTENGTYDIAKLTSWVPTPENESSLVPASGSAWGLPTENQWYKAAYYIPSTDHTLGKYSVFGTGSMTAPGNKWEEAVVANRANYSLNGNFTTTNQPRITAVGSFTNSPSPWGAYDMTGELNQWTSTFDASGNNIIIRGGSWKSQTSDELKSTARLLNSGAGNSTTGFRVAYNIPPTPVITHLDMMKDLVPVGDPGNAPDTNAASVEGKDVFGKVKTAYQIGKYDVTAEQYCMFLNAVASHADPHQLYNSQMATDSNVACMMRYGNANKGYSYFPWPGREKFPITYINLFSAARFCNWLENGQPIGDESPATTESGSYNCNDQGFFSLSTNNPKWLLPTADQWHKAAYYSPKDKEYYSFPTSSYSAPANDLSTATRLHTANYCLNNNFTTPTEPHLTPVGTFSNTTTPFGLYDMAGEVNQWTMTVSTTAPADDDSGDNAVKFIVCGGSWSSTDYYDFRCSKSFFANADTASNILGFRVVYNVPPSPLTVSEQVLSGAALAFKDVKDDVTGLFTGEIFKKPGTYFFNVMYYSVGAGLSEIAAKALNGSVWLLNGIFTQIANWIKTCFGDAVFSWFDGWIKAIYDFFLSPIKSGKLKLLKAKTLTAEAEKAKALLRMAMINNPLNLSAADGAIITTDTANTLATVSAATSLEVNAAVGVLAEATAAEAAQAAIVAFFASPAAAIIIPVLLAVGSYEAFIATTNGSTNGSNDPRIAIGLAADTLVRYIWPAIQLLL